jgi:hypothetical protein
VTGPVPPPDGPLLLTTARWRNDVRRYRSFPHGEWAEKPVKKLAHTGHLDQFAYGTDTASTWNLRDLQRCIIAAPHTGVIVVDVDDEQQFLATRTAALVGRAHAVSTRGGGFHVLLDARRVPPDRWPRQGPIAGGDIKSAGWVPVPGSRHHSGEQYQLVPGARIVPATPELVEAILADRADLKDKGEGGGPGGSGGGHDGQVAAATMGMIIRRLRDGWPVGPQLKEDVHAEWATVAVPRDPSDPFTDEDYDRHYGGGLEAALEIIAAERQLVTPDAVTWAQRTGPQQGGTVDPGQAVLAAAQARHELHEHNQGWLHDADVNQLDFTLCVAITGGSAEDDEKPWGIVVGGSSSAKSEDLKMVFGTADARLSDLTAAGLISWMGTGKNMKRTGLLPRLPVPAFVVIEDLAPLLSDTADKRNRSKLIALLRKVYDGEVQRDLGGTPSPLDWQGKVTMLAASTKVIDQQSALLDEAGPRWLLYRGTEATAADRLDGSGRRLSAEQKAEARKAARELAAKVVRNGRIAFGHMELTEHAAGVLGNIAVAVGILRGSVPRDGYGKREIIGIASTEEPYRLAAQLQLLARAALAFGHDEASAVGLARTVALGTVPPDRMKAMEVLCDGRQHSAPEIGRKQDMHRHVAKRALEDLQQLRVTACVNEDADADDPPAGWNRMAKLWELAGTTESGVSAHVIKAALLGTKSRNHPPSPPQYRESR